MTRVRVNTKKRRNMAKYSKSQNTTEHDKIQRKLIKNNFSIFVTETKAHLYEHFLQVQQIRFVTLGPLRYA